MLYSIRNQVRSRTRFYGRIRMQGIYPFTLLSITSNGLTGDRDRLESTRLAQIPYGEHVLDDFTAMREIVRVLAPGGMAILQVPLVGNHTFRDPTANTAEKRKRAHGQHNHVRVYGELDYAGLLGLAGLRYSPETPTPEQVSSFNLSENSSLQLCYKPT